MSTAPPPRCRLRPCHHYHASVACFSSLFFFFCLRNWMRATPSPSITPLPPALHSPHRHRHAAPSSPLLADIFFIFREGWFFYFFSFSIFDQYLLKNVGVLHRFLPKNMKIVFINFCWKIWEFSINLVEMRVVYSFWLKYMVFLFSCFLVFYFPYFFGVWRLWLNCMQRENYGI